MNDLSYAPFHKRLAAHAIDAVVCLFLVIGFLFVVTRPMVAAIIIPDDVSPRDSRAIWAAMDVSKKLIVFMLFWVSVWLPSGLYFAGLESSTRRATLGKMALKLVAVRMDGSKLSFLRATARYYSKAVADLVPFGFVATLPLYGDRRQGLHDWVTGVVVVAKGRVEAAMDAT